MIHACPNTLKTGHGKRSELNIEAMAIECRGAQAPVAKDSRIDSAELADLVAKARHDHQQVLGRKNAAGPSVAIRREFLKTGKINPPGSFRIGVCIRTMGGYAWRLKQ